MHQDAGRAQSRYHPVGKITGTLRGAAGEQHQIATLERIADGARERGLVVRHGPEHDRHAAGFGDGGRDDGAVAVVDSRRLERRAGRNQLIAGRQHRDIGLAHHLDGRDPARRQHADLARADARAPPQHDLAARNVGARIGDELSGRHRSAQVDRRRIVVHQIGMLDHRHRVGAARQHAAGRDGGGMAGRDLQGGRMAADDHFGIEAQAHRRRIARAR